MNRWEECSFIVPFPQCVRVQLSMHTQLYSDKLFIIVSANTCLDVGLLINRIVVRCVYFAKCGHYKFLETSYPNIMCLSVYCTFIITYCLRSCMYVIRIVKNHHPVDILCTFADCFQPFVASVIFVEMLCRICAHF